MKKGLILGLLTGVLAFQTAWAGFEFGLDLALFPFQLVGSGGIEGEISAEGYGSESYDGDFDWTTDPAFGFGLYGGYRGKNFFVGGEFGYVNVNGKMDGEMEIGGDDQDFEADADLEVMKLGGLFKYLFATKNPSLFPFVGGVINLQLNKIDPEDMDESYMLMMGFGVLGGVEYFFTESVEVFGGIRAEYYTTLMPATWEESEEVYGVEVKEEDELRLSWLPVNFFIGMAFAF